jgi:RNA polymerase sigma-70 factor (ECF subfamily)
MTAASPPPLSVARETARELLVLLARERSQFVDFARKRVGSGVDAEDLLHQAMLRAAEQLETLRDTERVEAWFYRVLRNTIADYHEQTARRRSRLDVLAVDPAVATPEEIATCACSLGVLADLRPDYREIVRRVDIDEEPLADVAAALAITTNNATVRLHRGRKALRDALARKCGTDSARACLDCACDDGPGEASP